MSSTEKETDLPKCSKNLFTLLSGSLNLKSEQFIATELERFVKELSYGLMYYKSYDQNKDSLTELNKQNTDFIDIEILPKMSLFLNLNAIQCKDLFESYLIYEFKGTPEMIKNLLTNEKQLKQLLDQLWDYYYSERIFTLFCVKQIMSHWKQSSHHVYHHIFRGFLELINADNQLLTKLMNQLKHLNESKVPSRLTNGPHINESLIQNWIQNNLKEQTEVLELLLLYFKEFDFTIDNVIELLKLFKSNDFGSKYSHINRNESKFIDEEVFKFIGFLQSILIVECLDLNWLFKCQQQDIEHQLINEKNGSSMKDLDLIISNLSAGIVEHSPMFMSWMIVMSWQISGLEDMRGSQSVSQLGSNALELHVFSYLEKCLTLPQMFALRGTVVSDIIYEAIASLLSTTFNVYNIEMLGYSIPDLNHLCISLFKNSSISKELFKNGLDFGLGMIINSSLNNFPVKVNPVLSFCISLSETENCKEIFEKLSIISTLTSYAEPFDSSLSNCVPTREDSTYMLMNDKILFHNCELTIKSGTKGVLKILNNSKIIEWKHTNIDGWKILFHRFKETYNLVIRGQLHSVTEVSIIEITQINTICSNLLRNNCFQHISSFNRLISLSFETYGLFSSLQNPFRLYMASILDLSASILKFDLNRTDSIWLRITEKRFMPYMIGLTTSLTEQISGNDTNTSNLGLIIAAEECIKGRYELCVSFLTLIAEVVRKQELRNDDNLIASVIYIVSDVFPSHYFWNYTDQYQFYRIERLCFDIFDRILGQTSRTGVRQKVEQICICSLMEGKAAESLLKVIKLGSVTVRNVISSAGNDGSLANDDQIIVVRHSLTILNYLLILHEYKKDSTTVVENALFSSQNKPNMLLIIFHYVFQRYDTHLATLAIQLLRQLAKRFPMSMMACLGSDAEAIREHMLYRLEEVTEDLNLKISLLNFMSACVQYQSGLIELFLNVNNPEDNNTTGCLQTVLEILTEKREATYFCPFELHLAALKFLYTFWLQPHLLAIDSLKKTSNVWTLITFPIFEDTSFNNMLCVYVLRILAREIFYVKTLGRDKFDCDLENKFKQLREGFPLRKLSQHICSLSCASNDVNEDTILILDSWKDFLVSIARFDPFIISKESKTILSNDLMDCLLNQLKSEKMNRNVIVIVSDILLMVFSKWKDIFIENKNVWSNYLYELIDCLNQNKDNLSFNILISCQALIIQYLQTNPEDINSQPWISSSCELVNQSLRIIEKQIVLNRSESELRIEFKLAVISVSLLQSLITHNRTEVESWIQILRSHLIMESSANLLNFLIDHRIGSELAELLMCFFITLSSIQTSAEALFAIDFANTLCISLQNTYTNSQNITQSVNWLNVFHLSMRMVINLIKQLKHHFIDTAITYVAIHLDHIKEVLNQIRLFPKKEDIQESVLIIQLCHSVSTYHNIWRKNHFFSYEQIVSEVSKTINSVTEFLKRPHLLSYVIENPETSTVAFLTSDFTPRKIGTNTKIDVKKILKSVSWETYFANDSMDANVQNSLLAFQAFSIRFLQNIKPNILDLMETWIDPPQTI